MKSTALSTQERESTAVREFPLDTRPAGRIEEKGIHVQQFLSSGPGILFMVSTYGPALLMKRFPVKTRAGRKIAHGYAWPYSSRFLSYVEISS